MQVGFLAVITVNCQTKCSAKYTSSFSVALDGIFTGTENAPAQNAQGRWGFSALFCRFDADGGALCGVCIGV